MTDQPTDGTPTSRAMSDGTPAPPPPAEGPGDGRRSRRPSKAILALGLAIVIVAGAAIIGVTSSGRDASQGEQRDPTTSAHATDRSTTTDAPATTTTTVDPAVLASERQAGAEAACTEAVNAPLGAHQAAGSGAASGNVLPCPPPIRREHVERASARALRDASRLMPHGHS